MVKSRFSGLGWIFDYVIMPLAIISIVYEPNFLYGPINLYEAGKELACINELFLGKLPYRDVFTVFGPLNIYLEALSMLFFGKNLAVLRAYFYIGTIFTLIIVYIISRHLCKGRLFSCAIALALLVETYHPYWATRWGGFRFGFASMAILCAINFFRNEKLIWAILAGVFTSIAFLVSFDGGIFSWMAIGYTFCFYVVHNLLKKRTLKLQGFMSFFIGILVALVPFLVYFASKNALLPYIDTLITIIKNQRTVWYQGHIKVNIWGSIHPSQILKYNFKYLFPVFLYVGSAIYLTYRIFKRTSSKRGYGILCLSIYGLLMYEARVAMHIIGPQFQMVLQPAIILGFVFLEHTFNQIIRLRHNLGVNHNSIKFTALIVIFTCGVSYFIFSEKRFYKNLSGWIHYQMHKKHTISTFAKAVPTSNIELSPLGIERAKGILVPQKQAEEIEGVTRYIIPKTASGEPVFTFPTHGIYNFLADRSTVGRFNIAGLAWTSPKYRKELLVELKTVKPRYIIYNRQISVLAATLHRREEILPEIIEYIQNNL